MLAGPAKRAARCAAATSAATAVTSAAPLRRRAPGIACTVDRCLRGARAMWQPMQALCASICPDSLATVLMLLWGNVQRFVHFKLCSTLTEPPHA